MEVNDGIYHGKPSIGSRIGAWFKAVPNAVAQFFVRIGRAFKSIPKKCSKVTDFIAHTDKKARWSFLLPGLGQALYKQWFKAAIHFGIFALYVVYMVLAGADGFVGFFTLGTETADPWAGTGGDNSVSLLLLGIMAWFITFFFIGMYIMNVKNADKIAKTIKAGKRPPTAKESLMSLIDSNFHSTALVIPITGVLILSVLPIVFMILIAFTNYGGDIVPPRLVDWTGFDSFARVFGLSNIGSTFGRILGWNLLWAVMSTFINYFGGLALALLLNKKIVKCKKIWRAFPVLAYAVPGFITLLGFKFMFANQGPINYYLGTFWGQNIDFLGLDSKWTARFIGLFVNAWLAIPTSMLLATGILSNMNTDQYEAARIDGASPWKQFIKITLPFVIFSTTPVLISSFVGNFNNFGVFYFLRGGLYMDGYFLASDTDLLINWLYNISIDKNYYSIGGAVSIIMFIIMSILSLAVYVNSSSYKREDTYR